MVMKAFRYRVYLTEKQAIQAVNTFGCCRYIYNRYLDRRRERWAQYKETYNYYNCASDLAFLKLDEDHAWLREADSTALQSVIKTLDTAFQNFRKRPNCGFPRYKRKRGTQSYTSKAVKDKKSERLNIRIKRSADGSHPANSALSADIKIVV